jgi:hypothetical protein
VDVDVVDGLATMISRIDDGAIALLQPFGAGNFCRNPVQMADQSIVLLPRMGDGRYVLAGNDKDVHRSLRIDVREGIAFVILIDGFGRDASIDDLAEDATHG